MITIANQDNLRIDPIRDLSDMKIINDRIEYVRCNLGFPIEYLAIEIGVPKTMLMRCLGKKNLYPSNDVIGGILKKFPVSQQWLLSGIGNPFNERDIEPFIFWGGKRIMDHDFPVLLSQLNKRSKFNYQNEIGNELKLNKEMEYKFIVKSLRGLTSNDTPSTINERLEWIRCVLGYEPKAFAPKIGSSLGAILNVLGEKNTDPAVSMVKSLCIIIPCVNEAWIWTGIGEPFLKDFRKYIFSKWNNIDDGDPELSRRIKELREDTGYTQALFAAEIGTTRDALAPVELNNTKLSLITAKQIITKFNVNPWWLLFGHGQKYLEPKF